MSLEDDSERGTAAVVLAERSGSRLRGTALATKQPLEHVMIRALSLGSPPAWDDAPPEFQVDLASLDRMDDAALWQIARSRKTAAELVRNDELLARSAARLLPPTERAELTQMRHELDLFVLRKAHAAALLRWRGHPTASPWSRRRHRVERRPQRAILLLPERPLGGAPRPLIAGLRSRYPGWMTLARIALPAALALVVLAGCGGDSPAPVPDASTPTPPDYEAAGPYPVGNATITIDDTARARKLRVEIWYPAAESARADAEKGFPVAELADAGPERDQLAKLIAAAPDPGTSRTAHAARGAAPASLATWPVVAFSHCFDCTRFSTFSIAERLASHGIAVVAPDHTGGTLADQLAGMAAPLDVTFLGVRARDIEVTLDRVLDAGAAEIPAALRGHFDPTRVGVFGHSFGGVTAGLVLTQDKRPIAGLALAVPMENPLLPGVTVADLHVPLFFMRADEDNSIGVAGDFVLDENFKSATSPVWKANVSDAGHWSFTDICGIIPEFHAGCGAGVRQTNGAAFEYLDITRGRAIAQAYTTAFFAAKLAKAAAGEAYLGSSRPEGIVTVTHRN